MKKIMTILLLLAVTLALAVPSFAKGQTETTTFDAKDGFGINAKYGQFELLCSKEGNDFWKIFGSLIPLKDTYTAKYKNADVTDQWIFQFINGEMCAHSRDFSAVVKFTAPVDGTYVANVQAHGWNNAQGVISTVGVGAGDSMMWNDDYYIKTQSKAEAATSHYTMTLKKGEYILFIASHWTNEITLDTLTVTAEYKAGALDTTPATEPVTEPVTEPATEPVTEPVTEPATDTTAGQTEDSAADTANDTADSTADANAPADTTGNTSDTAAQTADSTTENEITDNKDGSKTGLIIGIAAAAAVIIAAVVVVIIKKKK